MFSIRFYGGHINKQYWVSNNVTVPRNLFKSSPAVENYKYVDYLFITSVKINIGIKKFDFLENKYWHRRSR